MKEGLAKFDEISKYRYFSSVGQGESYGWEQAANWDHAIDECVSAKWKNCKLMARNFLHQQTEMRAWDRSTIWNRLCEVLQPKIASLISGLPNSTGISQQNCDKI